MSDLPLKAVRVLDLSMIFAGPLCARVLADLGAEVVKIEAIQHPDPVRALALADNEPEQEGFNRAGYFNELNMNKLDITVDLTSARGKELFVQLVRISDVVIENFKPGVMAAFGFGYDQLKAIKPDIILVSLSGYGQTGPWASWGAFGYTLEYACGLGSMTGYPDSLPRKQAISFTDPWAGVIGAGLIVTALHHRQRCGKGQHIDVSQRDLGSMFIGEALLDREMNGRSAGRIGNRHPAMAPHGQYRCLGEREWVVIAVSTDDEWLALRRALGDPEWARDGRLAHVEGRLANQEIVDQRIEEWTVQRDHYSAMRELQAAGVPAGAVLNGKEVLLDPHLKERGWPFVSQTYCAGPRLHLRQTPGWYSAWPTAGMAPKPTPTLGRDNEPLLTELLGLTADQVALLAEEQVIGSEPIIEKLPPEVVREILKKRMLMMQMVGKVEKIELDYQKQLGLE